MVIGIGASAGGLDAIQKLFDNIPENTGNAFVIIQHLSPDFISLMPELLAKHTKMEIFTAEDKQKIEPNCIYLNQRNKNLHIKGGQLYLLDKGPKHNLNLPIDIFFHTLGEEYKEKSIGVILSGTGSDGSRGIKTIKEAGGIIIAQDPESCQFDGMPKSAISTNLVDFIQTPAEIAKSFVNLGNKKLSFNPEEEDLSTNEAIFFNILEEIYRITNVDFRKYKKNTLLRRLEKRLNITNTDNLLEYYNFLKGNLREINHLKQDFLIGVTSFFRDKTAFEILKNTIIPNICNEKIKKNEKNIRIWTSGCSTGEEVYSIAILLEEHIKNNKLNLSYKIFATDIDARAINTASEGLFHINTSSELDNYYLGNYFIEKGEKIQVSKKIRDNIVFSVHNILSDPPFIRVDLISCRNMLIYLGNKAQEKVLFNFQFALNLYGYLFLGSSESLGKTDKLFKTISNQWKFYQNISENKRNSPLKASKKYFEIPIFKKDLRKGSYNKTNSKENPEFYFHRYLSNKYSPDTIFIDKEFNILFIKGNAGKRLVHKEGLFERNLLKMVSPEIAIVIRNGVRRLETKNKANITFKDVVNNIEDKVYVFDLNFHKPENNKDLLDTYVIQFSKEKEVEEEEQVNELKISNILTTTITQQQIEDLESELKATKTELQNVVEELETSNEELQSSNEELMASNEELQSTNEELQSVNEELYTVNSELQEKNVELKILNNDVNNLLNSSEIGTLFLDNMLNIRRFTPSLQKHFQLNEKDIGRPISIFSSSFKEEIKLSIINDAKTVMSKLNSIEKEIVDNEGSIFLRKINPFITEDKKIDGVVITFSDLTNIKKTEEKLNDSQKRYKSLFDNMNEGFVHAKIIKNKSNQIVDWQYLNTNKAFENLIGIKTSAIIGEFYSNLYPKINLKDKKYWIDKYSKTALTGEEQFFEDHFSYPNKSFIVHLFSPKKNEFAATYTDITERKKKEDELIIAEDHLKQVQDISEIGSWSLDLKTNKVTWTEKLYHIYGFDANHPAPSLDETKDILTEKSWIVLNNAIENTQKTGEGYNIELNIIKKDGTLGWLKSIGKTKKDKEGNLVSMWGYAQDITESKNLLEKVKFEKQFSERITQSTSSGIYIYDLKKGTNTFMNSMYTNILGYTMDEINGMEYGEFMSLFHPKDVKAVENHMQEIMKGNEHCEIDYRFKHKNGHWVWCYSIDSPFEIDKDGNVNSFIGVFIDNTLKKTFEEELKTSLEKVKRSNEELSQFAYIASHDLQEPLMNIMGFVKILLTNYIDKVDEQGAEILRTINLSSNRMHLLINALLNYSRIDNDKQLINFSPAQVLEEVLEDSSTIIKDKNVTIHTKNLPNKISGYKVIFSLLLQNLISNAIKYNRNKKPIVTISCLEKYNRYEFKIKDNGIGINKAHFDKVFELFKRLHNDSEFKGTGIGLAQCKKVVSLHNGDIWVESIEGKGSSFYFTISKNLK